VGSHFDREVTPEDLNHAWPAEFQVAGLSTGMRAFGQRHDDQCHEGERETRTVMGDIETATLAARRPRRVGHGQDESSIAGRHGVIISRDEPMRPKLVPIP
jgi:hypothetical protein